MDRLTILISQLKRSLEYMQSTLPYADGRQYFRDKEKIRELQADIAYWNRVKMIVDQAEPVDRFDSGDKAANDRSQAANEELPGIVKKQAI